VRRRWPDIRAGLTALAIVVGLVDGCPVPKPGRHELEHPTQRRELERWTRRLSRVGIDTTPDALADTVVAVGQGWARAQAVLLYPFRPIQRLAQLRQRWRLFPIAEDEVQWIRLEARGATGDWELLYRPLDAEHRFMAEALEYRRIRGAWNPGSMGPRGGYPHFVDWIAGEVFRHDPSWVQVRVRMERLRVRAREGVLEPTGVFDYAQARRR
jgi:hypothetical protein